MIELLIVRFVWNCHLKTAVDIYYVQIKMLKEEARRRAIAEGRDPDEAEAMVDESQIGVREPETTLRWSKPVRRVKRPRRDSNGEELSGSEWTEESDPEAGKLTLTNRVATEAYLTSNNLVPRSGTGDVARIPRDRFRGVERKMFFGDLQDDSLGVFFVFADVTLLTPKCKTPKIS
jgi:hypothetical protein